MSDLGFDVLYLTPIHPIGRTNRKGPNNSLSPSPEDHGSPYAIGSEQGGHDAIHPQLGSFADFEHLVKAAGEQGLEIALDFAIQCSPDHPWIKEHPEWFDWRADGTIKFAENPPKKYEDIVNVHFYRDAFPSIWVALRDVVLFWVDKGVKIFRVDNPHTKPFPFWEWLIRGVQDRHPEVIFLSEAFTRPKPMKLLAKLGFSQSYTYFTWRNTKQELTDYLTELTNDDAPNSFGRTSSSTRPTSTRPICRRVAGPVFRRASCSRRPWRATTASTVALSSARRGRCPVKRNISIPRNTKYSRGIGTVRAISSTDVVSHQPAAANPSGATAVYQPAVLQRLERSHPLLRQGHRG